MKTKIALGAVLLALGCGGIYVFFFKATVLAEVGTTQITDREVRLARKALKPLMPDVPNEAEVLNRMVKGQAIIELLKQKGINNFEEFFQQEMARYEATPERRKQIEEAKGKVGNNMEKFKKLVVIPMAADRLAFSEGYMKDESFNQEKREKAEAFFREVVKSPQRFSELAKKEKLPIVGGKWIKGRGMLLDDPMLSSFVSNGVASSTRQAERDGMENLEKLGPGRILDYLVDNRSGWWIIKSHGPLPSKDGVKIEAVVVKREPFGLWMQKNAKAVTIKRMTASESKTN